MSLDPSPAESPVEKRKSESNLEISRYMEPPRSSQNIGMYPSSLFIPAVRSSTDCMAAGAGRCGGCCPKEEKLISKRKTTSSRNRFDMSTPGVLRILIGRDRLRIEKS